MKPERIDAWRCSECGRTYTAEKAAASCCVCPKCGKPSGNGSCWCVECQNAQLDEARRERWERAEKVPWDEYGGDMVYVEPEGEYLSEWGPDDIREWWESCYDDPFPGFDGMRIWGTVAEPIALDPDELAQGLSDGAYEDYEVDGRMYLELQALCDEWNGKFADKAYWPDQAVRITYEGAR